jgi:hypothetical protein
MAAMTGAAKRGRGRPAIGATEQVWGRVSIDDKDWIEALAQQRGISQARVVGALLRFARQHEDQVEFPRSANQRENQQELPLTQAS